MKHVLLAGLIGMGGALWMGGCSIDDVVEDAVKPHNINIVNGTGGTINVTTDVGTNIYVTAHNLMAKSITTTGHDSITVKYDGGHSKKFSHSEGAYLYAATTCNNAGYISDHTGGERIHVVNLTAQIFTDSIHIVDADGKSFTITDNAAACAVSGTKQANDVKIGNGMQVKIGNGSWETIRGIPSEVEDIANKVKVDVIVYTTSSGTVVPMARYSDLK